jgi:cytoskeletal protein RodZ
MAAGAAYSAGFGTSMTTSAFGEHLRRERELRGIRLEEICAGTRISMHFLEALESGNWNELPGGVFRRGFIRSVSRFLGLDEESMVAEYAQETHDSAQPAATVPMARFDRRHWALSLCAAIVLLVIAALAVYIHMEHGKVRRVEHNGVSPGAAPREIGHQP